MKEKSMCMGCLLVAVIASQAFSQQLSFNGWYTYTDGKSTIASTALNEVIAGNVYTIHRLTGRIAPGRESYAGVTPQPDRTSQDLLKRGQGIKIRLRGDGSTLRLKIVTSDVVDYDYFGAQIPSAEKDGWVEVRYSDLRQEGWGRRAAGFNKNLIQELNLQINSPIRDFSVEIIEIFVF